MQPIRDERMDLFSHLAIILFFAFSSSSYSARGNFICAIADKKFSPAYEMCGREEDWRDKRNEIRTGC